METTFWVFENKQTGEEIEIPASSENKALREIRNCGKNPNNYRYLYNYQDTLSPNFELNLDTGQ